MKITLNKLRELNACYTVEKMLEISGGKKSMELIDIMQLDIPAQDRVWVACYCLPEKMRMEFSYTIATRALSRIERPDPRCVYALKVLRRYIDGEATEADLNTAACGACTAAYESGEADMASGATSGATRVANLVALAADGNFSSRATWVVVVVSVAVGDSVVRMVEHHEQINDIERLLESEGKNNE